MALPDGPLLACALAEPVATWLARIAAPALEAELGSPLVAVRTGPGYECRGRNRQAGGKPSAHAAGRALDVASFELADKRVLPISAMPAAGSAVGRAGEAAGVLQALRISACGWFTTVLGPGSDAFHADHLHVDIERRGSSDRYRICE